VECHVSRLDRKKGDIYRMNNKTPEKSTIGTIGGKTDDVFNEKWKNLVDHSKTKKLVKNYNKKIEKLYGDGNTTLQTGNAQSIGGVDFGDIIYPIYNRASLATMYTMNEIHAACINLLSSCIAGKGYQFLTSEKAYGMKKVLAFAKKPNQLRFGYKLNNLVLDIAKDLSMYHTVQSEIVHDLAGNVHMYRANPRYMFIQPDRDGFGHPIAGKVLSYWQVINGEYSPYMPYVGKDGLVGHRIYESHIQSPLSDYYGEPQYVTALKFMVENDGISEFNRSFFKNGAKPSFALIGTGHTITDGEKASIDAQMAANTGTTNTGKILTLMFGSEKAKIMLQQMSQSFDGSFLEQKKLNDESIMIAHQASSRLLGKSGSGSIGGGSEDYSSIKKYLETVVEEKQSMLEEYINAFLEEEFGVNPQFKLNSIDVMSEKDRAIISGVLFKIEDLYGNRAMDVEGARKYNDQPEKPMSTILTEPVVDDAGGMNTNSSGGVNDGADNLDTNVDATNSSSERIRDA
jgi:hypothetical protein